MLQRIVSIKNVGRFKNCSAIGDVAFRRYTLIFAENARGKTTLCDILRSLAKNEPAIVVGRTTLGSPDAPEVRLLNAAGQILAFRNGGWTGTPPDLALFDSTYVRENVYAGDAVDTEHRRNLYRLIIGAQGVALAEAVTRIDDQIRDKNTEIREKRVAMQRFIPQGVTFDAFVNLEADDQIDARIAAKEQEIQAARQATQLQARAGLSQLTVPVFPVAFAELLAKTLANVQANAEQHVNEHIARHEMAAQGETWISQGMQYMKDDSCPFCDQPIDAVQILEDYRSYFSQEYQALREEVAQLKRTVDTAIGPRIAAGLQQTLLQNTNSAETWQQFCEFAPPTLAPNERVDEILGTLRESALRLLDQKAGAPLDPVPPDAEFTQALGAFETLRAELGAYNTAVAALNEIIAAKKRQVQAANIRQLETELANLRATKVRHSADVVALVAEDLRLQNEKAALEGDKTTARTQLDAHTQQVITKYGQRINWYLERINASFRITTPTHTYRGGPPSTSYQILINQNSVDLGDPATPLDRPSFKNTLSSGDRSTLALAFFFAQLEQDANRANKVVVFDDPFGSMDSFRRSHTVHQIFRCGQSSAQVVVLSHDPNFLYLLWERIAPADRKTLSLIRIGEENTTVTEWDIERAVQARYRADIDTLQRFFADGQGDARDVIQKLRPILEAYCRNVYPTQFGEQEMMGGIITIIRAAGATHPLNAIVEDLDEINVYCRRYHHGENPNAATEAVDDAELHGYVKRTLKLAGCLL
jgi:wobble nucleotide-excising tRNase